MTKRIRCSCGRVYDPVKRKVCPDCGATNVVVATPEPTPEPLPPEASRQPAAAPGTRPAARPVKISPRLIAIAVGLVVLLAVVFSRRGGKEKTAAVAPRPTVAQASAAPTATALLATPTPNETPVSAKKEPTAAPTPVAVVTPPPTAPPVVPDGIDFAALIANAAPGATIQVPPGVYPGLVVTRPVHLVGDRNAQTFLKGEGQPALTVQSTGVSVENIHLLCHGIGALPAVSVAAGAELVINGGTVQSGTAIGLLVTGKASVKVTGTAFAVPYGAGLRLTEQAKATLTQCTISDTKIGLNAWSGATAELHSCAFERDGSREGHGTIFALNGQGTAVTADDCRFNSNTAGLLVTRRARATIAKSQFRENAAGVDGGILGLVSVRDGGQVTLTGDGFESNRQGVAVTDGGTVEIVQCNFSGNGLSQRQVVPASLPLLVSGEKSRASVRKTTFTDSAQYAIGVMAGGQLAMEDTDISGSRIAAVVLGERNMAPVHAEIRRSHLNRSGTGLGLLAGSGAEMEDCELRENNDGIIAFDAGTRLQATRTAIVSNRERGLYVYSKADASLLDCDLKNNARGAISGTLGRASENASITLEKCRLGGNRVFGAGAARQSTLILTNCVFDGTDKTNIYRERGAKIQTNDAPEPESSATPSIEAESSPTPGESASPSPQSSVEPSPTPEKNIPKPPRKPTPRPHPPTPDDIKRALRRLLPGG